MLLMLQICLSFIMRELTISELKLSDNNQAYAIDAFNFTSRYIDD